MKWFGKRKETPPDTSYRDSDYPRLKLEQLRQRAAQVALSQQVASPRPERADAPRELDWARLLNEAMTVPGNLSGQYSRFYSYSFLNCLLLRMQGAEGPVATYKRWQSVGRHVVRGATAMEILRPITVKKKDPNGQPELDANGQPKMFTKFKMVRSVFDYKDTTGKELPPIEVPAWNLDMALGKLDIKRVRFEELDGDTHGYSYDRNIAINPVAPYPLKTTFHEVSHIVNGHTSAENRGQYSQHRGLWEFEAEGAAHLLAHELEVDTAEEASVSRAYIQHWLNGERPSESAIRKVFTTADTILKAGRLATASIAEDVA